MDVRMWCSGVCMCVYIYPRCEGGGSGSDRKLPRQPGKDGFDRSSVGWGGGGGWGWGCGALCFPKKSLERDKIRGVLFSEGHDHQPDQLNQML